MRLYITNNEIETTKELVSDIDNELNEQLDCDELDELTKKFDEMKEEKSKYGQLKETKNGWVFEIEPEFYKDVCNFVYNPAILKIIRLIANTVKTFMHIGEETGKAIEMIKSKWL